MDKRLKVGFFVPDLTGGGAERMAIEYLRRLDRDRFEPHLILCRHAGVYADQVPEDVPVHDLRKRSRFDFPLLVQRFHGIVRQTRPDVVVSFLWYCDAIQLLARSGSIDWLAVSSLHAVPRQVRRERSGWLKSLLLRHIYPAFDAFMAVSRPAADEFIELYQIPSRIPVWVQPNPFSLSEIVMKSREPGPSWPMAHGRLVAVGRLHREKGFDVLLHALALLRDDERWCLSLLGEGPDGPSLKALANSLGIGARITFAGFVANPFPAIASADVLVLPSRSEAFPSVLVEAMAVGTPIVAVRCPTGPEAMLADGKFGRLAASEDPADLARVIEETLDDPVAAATTAIAARDAAAQWDAPRVISMFEERLTIVASSEA